MTLRFFGAGVSWLLTGLLLSGCGEREKVPQDKSARDTDGAAYYCPMHPQIVMGKPGSCPICGMDLVPIEAEEDASPSASETPPIQVDLRVLKDMEIHTVRIRRRPVSPNSSDSALAIPSVAIVRDGGRTSIVVALGQGRFASRAVRVGRETPTRVEILEGLKDGDVIVTSGQFLLDSEIRLRASASKIQAGDRHE
jgi:hypothetical protein